MIKQKRKGRVRQIDQFVKAHRHQYSVEAMCRVFEVAKWIGIKLTKESFARFLSKLVPILGGLISGTITWLAFSLMTNRLAINSNLSLLLAATGPNQ